MPESGSKRSRKHRQVVVCTYCRRRKIKCDKAQPCSNCTKNGVASSCSYESTAPTKPENEYTMELRFDLPEGSQSGHNTSAPRLGQFPLRDRDEEPSKKRSKFKPSSLSSFKKELVEESSLLSLFNGIEELLKKVVDTNTDISDEQKNEIQKLKERLEFIEKSLMRNGASDQTRSLKASVASNSSQKSSLSLGSKSSKNSPMEPYELPSNSIVQASAIQPHPLAGQPQLPSPFSYQPVSQSPLSRTVLPYQNLNILTPTGWTPSFIPSTPFDKTQTIPDSTFAPLGRSHSILPPLNPPLQNDIPGFPPTLQDTLFLKKQENTPPDYALPTSGINHSFSNVSRQDKLKYFLIGTNLFSKVYDTMSFYENYSSIHCKNDLRRMNFGPFCWSSIMRRDGALKLVCQYVTLKKENAATLVYSDTSSEITQETTNAFIKEDDYLKEGESQFKRRAMQTDGYEEVIPYRSILDSRKKRAKGSYMRNSALQPAALTHYDVQIDHELRVIEKIRSVMPKKRVIWALIDRFFAEVYVYMPYLDEEYFRADISRIIGPQSFEEEPVAEVNIEKKLDLAIVGILFIVLRLAYLSLLSNNESLVEKILKSNESTIENDTLKYLILSPIHIDIIHVAGVCLDQFHFLRRSNFVVLQLAIFLRIYHAFAPEDGDGADGGDSQVLSAVILQMAYQMGLHREPDENCTNLRINNLSRKIWAYLTINDVHLSYTFGNPLSIDERFHDTKFPFHVHGGENIRYKGNDQTIIDRFLSCKTLFPRMEEMCRLTLDVRKPVSLPKLTSTISQLEIEWFDHYGTLSDCITIRGKSTKDTVDRNFKIKTYLSTKAFLISVFFHIYLHYEESDTDMAYFYYKKCLLILIADIMPHYLSLLDNSEVVSDMIINPTVETMVHKSIQVYLSGILRVNLAIYEMRESKDHQRLCETDAAYMSHFQRLCQASSCLTRAAEYTISAINKISGRYYYAWRITKSQTIMLKTVTSSEFYKENYSKASSRSFLKFSDLQLQEVIILCENTLSMFRNSEFSTYGYSEKVDAGFKESPAELSQLSTTGPSSVPETYNDFKADKFWFQVLSYKNEMSGPLVDDSGETKMPLRWDASSDQGNGVLSDPLSIPGLNQPIETQVDLFSDIPFFTQLN